MAEVSDFDSEASLIESLEGKFTGNPKTMFGTAYHSLIEKDFKYSKAKKRFIVGDFHFTEEQAKPGIMYKRAHESMVHEMVVSKIYETKYFPIQVSGRIDGIEGLYIRDIKNKFREPKVQEYMQSIQWSCYLDMLDLNTFYFDLFEIKNYPEFLPDKAPYFFPDVEVIAHEPIECLRYKDMDKDILELLNFFLEYIHNRNFIHLLKPAINHENIIF